MPIRFPEPHWPVELLEEGPDEDRSILLGGVAEIGNALHRILAIRVSTRHLHLQVDFRNDLKKYIYADHELEVMLDELRFFGSIDRSVVVPLESGSYVIWMVPSGDERRD
jgi:hypothetical protein